MQQIYKCKKIAITKKLQMHKKCVMTAPMPRPRRAHAPMLFVTLLFATWIFATDIFATWIFATFLFAILTFATTILSPLTN
jgi:hypothetical protein